MEEEIFSLFHSTSKIGDHNATINNTVQKLRLTLKRDKNHYGEPNGSGKKLR